MQHTEIKMICYGARENEQPFFHQLNRYGFQLTLVKELLTADNVELVAGHQAVLLRGNCPAKGDNLTKMQALGVKYLLTRTVGIDHIDIPAAKALGFTLARVPGYSPNAIAELAVTLAMMLVRNVASTVSATSTGDFRVNPSYFSKEIRHMQVGILGLGKIGLTTASILRGFGVSQLYGWDPYPSAQAQSRVELLANNEAVLAKAELLFLHMPYIKEQNHHLVNADFLAKLPKGALLVNAARGEIVDTQAVVDALQRGHLSGFATDVLEDEATLFNKAFSPDAISNPAFRALVELYPRALITPHVGSNTEEACRNMIEQSFENLHEFLTTGESKNSL
ncbi:NAD(P)-dependent oxidoreductase [Entomospira culicis]|uniref:Lactate dehydrogenase n=1 Tax=Entomospira culicis TaxID=2719989 RepID=A0A968GIB5_9SPIO|nr:NAD(P)-dependent oxidoreductase [Entomospira culicis]NIZ19523.1 lactate dehydrogenase [Entomospira culicis]NIZ69572.1 lactate dehydrogenase [Entomospira culicis]WDI36683.1 NAD(P)-dependent oxidoreductase [Entomospira culicis]WDI38312.1 NAD(P)-dependent oxidoreductase [Entomospira culicis]